MSSSHDPNPKKSVNRQDTADTDQWSEQMYDVDDPDSTLSRFLRYDREVYGSGTMDPQLIQVL